MSGIMNDYNAMVLAQFENLGELVKIPIFVG